MVTKSELLGMDLSGFTRLIEQLSTCISANEDRLEAISEAKARVKTWWEGDSADAAISALEKLEQRVSEHITHMTVLQGAISTYCTNKTKLQAEVVECVTQIEAQNLTVSDTWQVAPAPSSGGASSFGPLSIVAATMQVVLSTRVNAFVQYDLQAAVGKEKTPTPYTSSQGYSTTKPDRTIQYDDDFPYGSKKGDEGLGDYANWAKWGAIHAGAEAIADMPDACELYAHFRDGSGTPRTFDYDKAYEEDAGVRNSVNNEVNQSLQAANEAVGAGQNGITLHSPMHNNEGYYPQTENWQKAIGGYSTYTETDVQVSGDTVTATVTVYAQDKYNFNAGAQDIRSGASDAENGRFEELGWARSFETSGSTTQTYTWKVGEQPPNLPTDTTENARRS